MTDFSTSISPESSLRTTQIDGAVAEIKKRRHEVLSHYLQFKERLSEKKNRLQDVKEYQYFKRDVSDLEERIMKSLESCKSESLRECTNAQAKLIRHNTFETEVEHLHSILSLIQTKGISMMEEDHLMQDNINKDLSYLHELWEKLKMAMRMKGVKLKEIINFVDYVRNCDDIIRWIYENDKRMAIISNDVASGELSLMQRKFDDYLMNLSTFCNRVRELNITASRLLDTLPGDKSEILRHRDEVNRAWEKLNQKAFERRDQLFGAQRLQRLQREVEEIKSWIKKKECFVETSYFFTDLKSVKNYIRKHEGFEWDLAALDEKIKRLNEDHKKLLKTHHNSESSVLKIDEVNIKWEVFKKKYEHRKSILQRLHKRHTFLADCRDLLFWMTDLQEIISSKELGHDVDSTEELLDDHLQHKDEMDARQEMISQTLKFGNELMHEDLGGEVDIKDSVISLTMEYKKLRELWRDTNKLYNHSLQLQIFLREADQINAWLQKQISLLSNDALGKSLDEVEFLLNEHNNLERRIVSYDEKIDSIIRKAKDCIGWGQVETKQIVKRGEVIEESRRIVIEMLEKRRSDLCKNHTLMLFDEHCVELISWINEKLKNIQEESDYDLKNIRRKVHVHHVVFEQEIKANQKRVDDFIDQAKKLKEEQNAKVKAVIDLWKTLTKLTSLKGIRLLEAADQKEFNRDVVEFDKWLSRIEEHVRQQPNCDNLCDVQRHIKNTTIWENEYLSHKQRLEEIKQCAQCFNEEFQIKQCGIVAKIKTIEMRFERLVEPLNMRSEFLNNCLMAHKQLKLIEDEMCWIKEKEQINGCVDSDSDFLNVKNLLKKHETLEAEIINHQQQIDDIVHATNEMMKKNHLKNVIEKNIQTLIGSWIELEKSTAQKKNELTIRLQLEQYMCDAMESENWMREKEIIFLQKDLGKDEDSTKAMFKKHLTQLSDVIAYRKVIDQLRIQATQCQYLGKNGKSETFVIALHDYYAKTDCELSLKKDDVAKLLCAQNRNWWKITFCGREGFIPSSFVSRVDSTIHFTKQKIVEDQYEKLLAFGELRQRKLLNACDVYQLLRKIQDMNGWITAKEQHSILVYNYRDIEQEQKKFEDFKTDMKVHEGHLVGMNEMMSKLIYQAKETESNHRIIPLMDNLNSRWRALCAECDKRSAQLVAANEVYIFHRKCDETKDWIQEKMNISIGNSLENELESVRELKMKRNNIMQEMIALEESIKDIDHLSVKLKQNNPEVAEEIYDRQKDLNDQWNDLKKKAEYRKQLLHDAINYQMFLNDYVDFVHWIKTNNTFLSDEDFPKDVNVIEALKERHNEQKIDIDSRIPILHDLERAGYELLRGQHYKAGDVSQKLKEVNKLYQDLINAWLVKDGMLKQYLDFQLFYQDCESAEMWMTAREEMMNLGDASNDNFDALLMKHEDMNKDILGQQDKINHLNNVADQLLANGHYAHEDINRRKREILIQWEKLKTELTRFKNKLGESQTVIQFVRSADEIENWINDKMHVVDESYHGDLTIMNKNHMALQAELHANEDRVGVMMKIGHSLLAEHQEEVVEEVFDRVQNIEIQWKLLLQRFDEKRLHLKATNDRRRFDQNASYLELWLFDVETMFQNEDCGKDLPSCQRLIKKHQLLEADIVSYQDCFSEFIQISKLLNNDKKIINRRKRLTERYIDIQRKAKERRNVLNKSVDAHQFLRVLSDEKSWINEKRCLVSSEDYGKDLIGVENLKKKHRRLEAEVQAHESQLKDMLNEGKVMLKNWNKGKEGVEKKIAGIVTGWKCLCTVVEERKKKLLNSEEFHRWADILDQENAWISENEHILHNERLGNDVNVVHGILKKFNNFRENLKSHTERIENLQYLGKRLVETGNHYTQEIIRKSQHIGERLATFSHLENLRVVNLHANYNYMQFLWKCDVVESWIVNKESQLRDENVHNVTDIRWLLNKQDAFDGGLDSFKQDGILICTQLRDQLIKKKHPEIDAIEQRHLQVVSRWNSLLTTSSLQRKKIMEVGDKLQHIDDLHLAFATKASAFYSWYESVEEDLTDPVRCNCLDEIISLCEAHSQFVDSLKKSQNDFDELVSLNKEVSQICGRPNPYTWSTMESITETLNNLSRIVKERENDLEIEHNRQTEHDLLKREFAKMAKAFTEFMGNVRVDMLTEKGNSLEEELDFVRTCIENICANGNILKKIEEMAMKMEKRLILDNSYTTQSPVDLSQAYDQLVQLGMRMQHNLERQIQARNQSGVTEEALKEFNNVFKYFDREKTGSLSHHQFKAALRALGYNVPLVNKQDNNEFAEIIQIVDPAGEGVISLHSFMSFVISRETSNVHGKEEIESAFRVLTKDGKNYVTKEQLISNLPTIQAEWCLRRMSEYTDSSGVLGLDYKNFVHRLYD